MTDKDTITLPRAVGDEVRDLLCHADFTHFHFAAKRREMLLRAASALAALDTALGAEMSATGDDCRQPATVEQVIATHGPPWGRSMSPAFFSGWRAAERHHGIKTEDET